MRCFCLATIVCLCTATGSAGAATTVTYETRDADPANDLPCYRLTLGAMSDQDGRFEIDAVYRGVAFILRSIDSDDCTHMVGEASYDENHSFFMDVTMKANCKVPLHFASELKARHDRDGPGFGAALCKKLRRNRDIDR